MTPQIFVVLVLSGIGIVNTLYLSYHAFHKTPVRCFFFPPEWCKIVQTSKFSKTLGIPNAYMGFAMYLSIFLFTVLFLRGAVSIIPVQGIIAIGFLFSLYFTYIQAAVLKAFCTWCVFSAIDFLFLFVLIFFL